ncbi:MAG: hypothetical protein ACE5JB_06975 [bacterium]
MTQIIQRKSEINYSYATIRITQSRIDKGLIAIPMPLAKWFPAYNTTIKVFLGDTPILYTKNYEEKFTRYKPPLLVGEPYAGGSKGGAASPLPWWWFKATTTEPSIPRKQSVVRDASLLEFCFMKVTV